MKYPGQDDMTLSLPLSLPCLQFRLERVLFLSDTPGQYAPRTQVLRQYTQDNGSVLLPPLRVTPTFCMRMIPRNCVLVGKAVFLLSCFYPRRADSCCCTQGQFLFYVVYNRIIINYPPSPRCERFFVCMHPFLIQYYYVHTDQKIKTVENS